MKTSRSIYSIILLLMSQIIVAQQFEFTIEEIDPATSTYHASLAISPDSGIPDAPRSVSSGNTHDVIFGFDVQLQQSNAWLINPEADSEVEFTPEEIFTRDLFRARQSMSSIEDLRGLIDENFYLEKEQLYARDTSALLRESSAFRNFVDIRLLAVVLYGDFYFFLNAMKFRDESMPDVTSAILVKEEGDKYVQTNALSRDNTTTFFFSGRIKDEIFQHLDDIVEDGR